MIAEGFFHGVIDLAPGGVGEHYFGYMRDGGPDRLESAAKTGIPQIISTCSVNHMTPARSKYKKEFMNGENMTLINSGPGCAFHRTNLNRWPMNLPEN